MLFTVEQAKRLRIEETPAEKLLWKAIRGKALGYKFRRQHGIGPFIVDFYCDAGRIIVELDGPIHNKSEVRAHDKVRDEYLTELGYSILRFTNNEILKNLPDVLNQITNLVTSRLSSSYGGVGGGK